jgi:hypothetical protein
VGDAVMTATEPRPMGPYYPQAPLTTIDIDGDGIDEIIVDDYIAADLDDIFRAALVLRRSPEGWAVDGKPLPVRDVWQPFAAATGDVDGDGSSELVIEEQHEEQPATGHSAYDPSNNELVVLGSDGAALVERYRFAAGTWPRFLRLADLDQDGRLDLIVVGYDRIALAAGTAEGVFATPQVLTLGGETEEGYAIGGVEAGDLDLDGDLEIVVIAGPSAPTWRDVLVVSPDPLLNSPVVTPLAAGVAAGDPGRGNDTVVRDLTGDGVLDIAIHAATGDGPDIVSSLSIFVADP